MSVREWLEIIGVVLGGLIAWILMMATLVAFICAPIVLFIWMVVWATKQF